MQLPNPLKTPSWLQKLQWVADPVSFMERAARQYPDIFSAELVGFGNTVVFVNNPLAIQQIFNNDRKTFAAPGELNKTLQPVLGNSSILMLDGDNHKHRRQIVMPSLHGDRMRFYGQLICDLTKEILSQVPINKTFLARNIAQDISLQVIIQVVFGLQQGERYQQIQRLIPAMISELFTSPLNSSFLLLPFLQKNLGALTPWGRFLRQRQQIAQLLDAEIAERRQQNDADRTDILSLLMLAQDEAGESMTDRELQDELMSMIIAGHETTATAIAWGLYWIHRQPEVYEKLRQELDTLGDSPDPMNIFRLPYLSAICNEILRINPVAMFSLPRVVQEPVKLLGHALEPGTVLLSCIYLTHQREDLYPQAKQFKPERFLERQFSPYEFMPFGGGVRVCIGKALALFEMKLVLATILLNYKLSLADLRQERTQRKGVVLGPANGVKMLIKERCGHSESPMTIATTSAS